MKSIAETVTIPLEPFPTINLSADAVSPDKSMSNL